MAKDIGDGLRYAVDWDRDAFNVVCLGAVAEKLVGEADDTQRRIVDLRLPVLRADRDPHPSRHLVSDAVEGEGRDEADDTLGHALGSLGEGVIAVGGGVSKLIESAAKPGDEAIPPQTGDSGRSKTETRRVGQECGRTW